MGTHDIEVDCNPIVTILLPFVESGNGWGSRLAFKFWLRLVDGVAANNTIQDDGEIKRFNTSTMNNTCIVCHSQTCTGICRQRGLNSIYRVRLTGKNALALT